MAYASGTTVDEGRTRQQIETMLQKAGASKFGTVNDYDQNRAQIGFVYKNIQVRMDVTLPDRNDKRFKVAPSGRWSKSEAAQLADYQAEIRRRWRSLAMVLKAKLVAVEEGVTTLEREFLPYMVMANGRTFGEEMAPQIEAAMGGEVLCLPAPAA